MNATVSRIEELLMAQQFADAHRCAVDALVAAPDDYRPPLALARADLHLGSLERALWAADRACVLAPDQSAVHFVRAEILGAMGQHREQLHSVRIGLELSPGSNHGRQMLALATERVAARRAALQWWTMVALMALATALGTAFVGAPHGPTWSLLVAGAGLIALTLSGWVYRRHQPTMAPLLVLPTESAQRASAAPARDAAPVTMPAAAATRRVRHVEPAPSMVAVGN